MTDELDTAHVDRLKADVLWEILADLGYVDDYCGLGHEHVMASPSRVRDLARALDAIQAWKFGVVPT